MVRVGFPKDMNDMSKKREWVLKQSDKNGGLALIPFAAYNQAGEASSNVHRCKRKWGAEIPQSLKTATGKGVQAIEGTGWKREGQRLCIHVGEKSKDDFEVFPSGSWGVSESCQVKKTRWMRLIPDQWPNPTNLCREDTATQVCKTIRKRKVY